MMDLILHYLKHPRLPVPTFLSTVRIMQDSANQQEWPEVHEDTDDVSPVCGPQHSLQCWTLAEDLPDEHATDRKGYPLNG